MAYIDIPIKRLIQLTLNDWVKLIVPNTKSIEITEMDKEKVPKIKSSMDKEKTSTSNHKAIKTNRSQPERSDIGPTSENILRGDRYAD